MAETPAAVTELSPLQKWLEPVGMVGDKPDHLSTIQFDPANRALSTREQRTVTDVRIPPKTPEGSYVVSLSHGTTGSRADAPSDRLVQLFRVTQVDGRKVLEPVALPQGADVNERNEYLLRMADQARKELPLEKAEKTALVLGKLDSLADVARLKFPGKYLKPKEIPVTRTLKPSETLDDDLWREKKDTESFFQRLPSQSPQIQLGLLTAPDVSVIRYGKQTASVMSRLSTLSSGAPA